MGSFTWGNAIALATLMFIGASALLGVWWRIEQRIRSVENDSIKRDASHDREVSALKVHLAENYAQWETVREVENRLADRIEVLSTQMMAMPDVVVERIMKFIKYSKQQD